MMIFKSPVKPSGLILAKFLFSWELQLNNVILRDGDGKRNYFFFYSLFPCSECVLVAFSVKEFALRVSKHQNNSLLFALFPKPKKFLLCVCVFV